METYKFVIFLIFVTTILTKEFRGVCPFGKFRNFSECVNEEFFNSQSLSNISSKYQVIAKMEYDNAQGISLFYTYEQNLVAIISSTQNLISITSRSCKSHFNFFFKFESSGLCNVISKPTYILKSERLNLLEFIDKRKGFQTYVTKKNEFLAFWGCFENNDFTYDLAAWILFSNSSFQAEKTEELKRNLRIFLKLLNQEANLNFSENDFKLNELVLNFNICDTNYKEIYKKISKDVLDMKSGNYHKFASKSSEFKFTFTFGFLITLITVIGIYLMTSMFLTNRCRVSEIHEF